MHFVYSRNLTKRINTMAVPLVRYSGPFSKRTREELQEMDQRTRKLMTMHKALHPRDDVDRLCVKKRRRMRTCQYSRYCRCIDATIRRLHKKAQEETDYSCQRQYKQNKHQWNKNNQKNVKKYNCMDISSDNQAKSYMRKLVRG